MDKKNVRGILALALVTALSFGVILGAKALSEDEASPEKAEDQALEELDVRGAEHIQRAVRTGEGYLVTAQAAGYGGDILVEVAFKEDKRTIARVSVTEQSETENLGARIGEPEFLDQFQGAKAPVYLPGMSLQEEEAGGQEEPLAYELRDGTYEAQASGSDSSGFTDQMIMRVEEGKITQVVWESVRADGAKKSVLSENGEYTMTQEGLTWKEQSEALAAALVEQQSLDFLKMDQQGKTDAVAGVSISVGGFAGLAEQCLKEAAGLKGDSPESQEGTQVDGVSGATVSSRAAVEAVNSAYEFLRTAK